MEIIQHDVRRLDRLISDISDASRLDAELAREDAKPVDMADLLRTTVSLFNDIHRDDTPEVVLDIAYAPGARPYRVIGHDSRLSQVIVNLLDNAISFSPPGGRVAVRGAADRSRDPDRGRGRRARAFRRRIWSASSSASTPTGRKRISDRIPGSASTSRARSWSPMAAGSGRRTVPPPACGAARGTAAPAAAAARVSSSGCRQPDTATREACLREARELVHGTCVALGPARRAVARELRAPASPILRSASWRFRARASFSRFSSPTIRSASRPARTARSSPRRRRPSPASSRSEASASWRCRSVAEARLVLVCDLVAGKDVPRMPPEPWEQTVIAGVAVPR